MRSGTTSRLATWSCPGNVKLLVSFVPPVSGLATLHLVVKMAEDLIATVRLLAAEAASAGEPAAETSVPTPLRAFA